MVLSSMLEAYWDKLRVHDFVKSDVTINVSFQAGTASFVTTNTSVTHDFVEVITDTEGVFDTIIDTTISGKQFSGSGTMFDSGSARVETVNGRFYGDSAEEIGGTFIFSEPIPDENTATYIGAFGAVSTP